MEYEHVERQQNQRSEAEGDPMPGRDGQVLDLASRDSTLGDFRKQ